VALAFFAAGLALAPPVVSGIACLEPELVRLDGIVRARSDPQHPSTSEVRSGYLDLVVRDTRPIGVRVYFSGARDEVLPGDEVRVTGMREPLSAPDNPGMRDPRIDLGRAGIEELVRAESGHNIEVRTRGTPSLRRLTASLRARVLEALFAVLPPDACALACALLVGQTRDMAASTVAIWRRTGTLHYLAVSGTHLTLLLLFFRHATGDARGRRRWVQLAQMTFVVLYMGITDFTPSIVRAGALALASLLGQMFERRVSLENALLSATIALLLVDPAELFMVGFQLSLAATVGIAILTRPLIELFRPAPPVARPVGLTRLGLLGRGSARALAVSLAASLATWPLSAQAFGTLVPLAPIFSVLVLPFITILMALSLVLLVASLLHLPGIGVLATSLCAGAGALERSLATLDRLPGTPATEAAVPWTVTALALVAVACLGLRRFRVSALLALATALASSLLAARAPAQPRMVTLSVGHGLSVLFQSREGTILYDAGSSTRGDVGARIVVPALRALGVRRLDLLVLSHFDADHVNGVAALLDFFPPARCLVPSATDDRAFARDLLASLRAAGCLVTPPGVPWPERIGPFALAYSTSARPAARADNDHSIVLRVSFGATGVLLTGDIGAEGVDRVVRSSDVCDGVDILFLPHHGMSCAGLPRLQKRIQPRLLVLSGERPAGRRQTSDPALLRTYDHGAVLLSEDGSGLGAWSFSLCREVAHLPW
jgi:competence protein ComEC